MRRALVTALAAARGGPPHGGAAAQQSGPLGLLLQAAGAPCASALPLLLLRGPAPPAMSAAALTARGLSHLGASSSGSGSGASGGLAAAAAARWAPRGAWPAAAGGPGSRAALLAPPLARAMATVVPRPERRGNRFAPNPPTHQTLDRYPVFRSRKPAIKKPSAHQWHFCDADYDPMAPLPKAGLPHYAPPWARGKDYAAGFQRGKPERRGGNRWLRGWTKTMRIRSVWWRDAWLRAAAIVGRRAAATRRRTQAQQRAAAWRRHIAGAGAV